MRAIEKEMNAAILSGRNWSKSNTSVLVGDKYTRVYLHGNEIARIYPDGRREFSSAGWKTVTTKSRLNALGAGIYQKNFEWHTADGSRFVNAF